MLSTEDKNTAELILKKIEAYDRIIIGRHFRPDGDAIGSTMGLAHILRATYPKKEVYAVNEDFSEYCGFLNDEKTVLPDEMYGDALFVALDCGTEARLSNKKFGLAKEIIKIDHHVEEMPYGDISWVDDTRSSTCEMIVEFVRLFEDRLKFPKEAATALFTGMVTDSGRFRFADTSESTMYCAGFLLRQGIDTETIYANLYLEDFNYYKFQSYVFGQMRLTENGVAVIHVDRKMQEEWHLTHEQASETVSMLNSIRGSIIWIAFIDNMENDEIRVRLRSRFVSINQLAGKYRGGGHLQASGATVFTAEEMEALIRDADALSKEYKENNTGWM